MCETKPFNCHIEQHQLLGRFGKIFSFLRQTHREPLIGLCKFVGWEQQPTIKCSSAQQVKTVSSEAAVSAVLCDPALHISVCPSFRYLALFDTYLSTASSLYLVVIDPPSPLHPSVWLENGRNKKTNKKNATAPINRVPLWSPPLPIDSFISAILLFCSWWPKQNEEM